MLTESRVLSSQSRTEWYFELVRASLEIPPPTCPQLAARFRCSVRQITRVRSKPSFKRELAARRKERDDIARAAWERAMEREIERRIREGEGRRARAQVMNYKRRGKDGRYTTLNPSPAKRVSWDPSRHVVHGKGGLMNRVMDAEFQRIKRRESED